MWIAPQWNNILFDVMLSGFGELFGFRVAERISVSIAVLIFFWGVFAFIGAATRRVPWFLLPVIAIFTYGWTFEMGLMNYYISIGLSFLALAIFWRSSGSMRLIPLLFVPFIWMAHPLGIIWLAGSAGYIALAERSEPRHDWYLLAAAGIFLAIVRIFLVRNYQVGWPDKPFYLYNGADQLVLYGARYFIPAGLFMAFAVIALGLDAKRYTRPRDLWAEYRLPLELFVVAGMASVLLPSSVALPEYSAPITLLTQRLSLVLGILVCCILGAMRPRKWHLIGSALVGVIFFSFLYRDTRAVSQMEDQGGTIHCRDPARPPGHQFNRTTVGNSRIVIQHILDRACIAHCFSYENYEPSTDQFRVRAVPGNFIVDKFTSIAQADQSGKDEATPSVISPAFEIHACGAEMANICVRDLSSDGPGL